MSFKKIINSDDNCVKDQDGKKWIFDGTGSFAAWVAQFKETISALGFSRVLGEDIMDVPVRPDAAIYRFLGEDINAEPPYPRDEGDIREWKKEVKSWDGMCGIVLNVLKRSISEKVTNTLRLLHQDMITTSRANINALLGIIRAEYGVYTPERAKLNFFQMTSVDPFSSVLSTIMGLKKNERTY